MRRALAAAALAALAVVASARVEPSPRATGRRPLQEEAPAAFAFSSDEPDDALKLNALGTNGAHAAAHAALCALEGAALEPCDEANPPAASPASDDALNPAPPPAPAAVPPAFIYDQLLTANLVLSSTALFRRGDVLSLAGAANALNLTDAAAAASEELSRPGAPILVPNAPPTRVIVQLAAGVVQLQALASTFLAFTPEWAAAQAAFAAAEEGEEAAVAEEVAETDEVVGGRKRSRKRRSLLRRRSSLRRSFLRRSRRRSLLGETGETPPNDPGGGGGGGETDDRSAETRRAALEAEAARDFRRVERRVLAGDEDENDDDRASGGGASGASLAAYVAATLEEVRGAVGGTGGGGVGTPEVGESSGVDTRLGAFEWRSGAVKSPAALRALGASGFWRAFAEGLPDDGVDVLLATLGAPARRGEEGAAGGGSGGDGGMGDASDASDDGLDDDSDVPLGAHTNASSSSSGGSPFTTSSARRRETLEDVLDQLRDVEPKFDLELSVIVRPIATTLFAGVAARSWNHAALRLAPDEVTPFAYSDPLALAAVDLLPEVAVAYAESLRAANATEEEIKRKLGDAVNVRFVVTVALITRQQISVGGGDILRNIFTLEL